MTSEQYKHGDHTGDNSNLPPLSDSTAEPTLDQTHTAGGNGCTRFEGFKLLEKIGEGGMGEVWRAHEVDLQRVVALKLLSSRIAGNASAGKRFRREAILAANLSHPNIVPVFRIDKVDPPRYFSMEFVSGCSLGDKIEQSGYLRPVEGVRIILQACDALAHAHERNVIHRDIKPSNILLENHIERVRITDFGIAQDSTGRLGDLTVSGQSSGMTLNFASPEQNLGLPLNGQSDIFSLGVTFYYMLTGNRPYSAKSAGQLALAYKEQTPLPPSRTNHEVNDELDRIVMKMMAPSQENRYGSCREVAADLRRLPGDPASAREALVAETSKAKRVKPSGPPGRVRERSRHRDAAVWGGVLLVAILFLAGALWWAIPPDEPGLPKVLPPGPMSKFEQGIRIRIADIQLGAPIGFYRQFDDPETVETVRRWDAGVKVANIGDFERKNVPGKGWLVVLAGTQEKADSTNIVLMNIDEYEKKVVVSGEGWRLVRK